MWSYCRGDPAGQASCLALLWMGGLWAGMLVLAEGRLGAPGIPTTCCPHTQVPSTLRAFWLQSSLSRASPPTPSLDAEHSALAKPHEDKEPKPST